MSTSARLCAFCLTAMLTSGPAPAAEPPPVTPTPTTPEAAPDWSMGLALSAWSVTVVQAGGLLGLFSGASPTPRVDARLERRLAGPLWLRFGLGAGFASSSMDLPLETGGSSKTTSTSYSVGTDVGLRWAANPGDLVEVSVLGDVGYEYRHTDRDSDPIIGVGGLGTLGAIGASHTHHVHASLGLAAELELVDALALRLATRFVELAWARSKTDMGGGPAESENVSIGITLSPSLELRYEF